MTDVLLTFKKCLACGRVDSYQPQAVPGRDPIWLGSVSLSMELEVAYRLAGLLISRTCAGCILWSKRLPAGKVFP